MKKKDLHRAEICFKVGEIDHEMVVMTNLPETFGMSIDGAVENWLMRTKDFSVKSFCDYVESKDSTIICLPEML